MEATALPKAPVTIALAPDLRDRLDAAATAAERSRSYIAGLAIREYLARQAAAQQGDAP
jgi:predicted transcriptional regulator